VLSLYSTATLTPAQVHICSAAVLVFTCLFITFDPVDRYRHSGLPAIRIGESLLLKQNLDMSVKKIKLKQTDIQHIKALKDALSHKQLPHTTIQQLAYEAGMNRTKLQYGFKKLFGISIYSYQLQMRMEKARKLLAESDKPIKQIAALTGYNTISSFSAAFKKAFRLSPSQYREENQ
jgi:AraC-like DNA-binding protein